MVCLIIFTSTHPPPPLLLLVSRNQQLWPSIHRTRTAFLSVNPIPISPRRIHTKNRRWDSNAETFRTQNFDFNSGDDDDDEFEDDDGDQWLDILEDFIDGVWIFKVFRSFGWFLPAIISSLLLTSGPKAFLMALAIPIGQSALSMLFQTVWGRPENKTRRRGKSKSESRRKPPPPPPRRGGGSYVDDEEEEYPRGERKRAGGYQTWVAGDGGLGDTKSNGSSASFGGWEELDRRNGSNTDRKRKTSKSKLSRKERRSSTPLFIRLLIAVFPFLGSWTRML